MAGNREVDEATNTETTEHEWDGIKELDTPMPR
jgi:cytochrome c oxidase cbb3-type subunit III